MPPIHVGSEIGPLRAVLVHTPGKEVLAVTPLTKQEYLYDDIIDLEAARTEHRKLVAVLERFAEVYEVRDLLRDLAEDREARDRITTLITQNNPSAELSRRLADTSPEDMVSMVIEGTEWDAGPIARALNEGGYALPPLPNLFFTRDVGIVLRDHAVVGAMRHGVRWSEELLVKALFVHHPKFENAGILYDGSEERRLDFTLEGGDVHPVRPDLLILGQSDRTSAVALDLLCERVFETCDVSDVIVVVMPGEPTAIHLDMIFTQVDRELCVVSPKHFIGPERLAVLHRRRGQAGVSEMSDFFDACKAVDFPLEPILCGGTVRSVQEREQWASGCNLLTLRPGVALAYRRNEATLAEMQKAGFAVVQSDALLLGEVSVEDDARTVITTGGSELVRGGGGPRCMTLPLRRDQL